MSVAPSDIACRRSYGGPALVRDESYDRAVRRMMDDVRPVLNTLKNQGLTDAEIARRMGRSDNSRLREYFADIRSNPREGRERNLGLDIVFRIARDLGMNACGGVMIERRAAA